MNTRGRGSDSSRQAAHNKGEALDNRDASPPERDIRQLLRDTHLRKIRFCFASLTLT
jgi:hypothetical protein